MTKKTIPMDDFAFNSNVLTDYCEHKGLKRCTNIISRNYPTMLLGS